MKLLKNVLVVDILMVISLYVLQGYIQGLIWSIPLYLSSNKASWKDQTIFSCSFYPFSLKILWAPLLDSIYSNRFGRYITWLIPIQILIGLLLILLSFHIDIFLKEVEIIPLTMIFLLIYFLTASQDIVVDGWSILLFSKTNVQWASTCQTIGQVIGYFLSSSVLMIFESTDILNKYIRQPLSLDQTSSPLFSLNQFVFAGGFAFLFVTLILFFRFYSNKQTNQRNLNRKKLNLFETYFSIFKLFEKSSIRQLSLILLTYDIGFAPTNFLTLLILSENGLTREKIALINIPSFLIHILVPLYLTKVQRPLRCFSSVYIPRLLVTILICIYISMFPQLINQWYFYPILIFLFCLNETMLYLMVVSRVAFSAQISQCEIAGTYMTLLAAISNLGQSLLSTCVFSLANCLPKSNGYFIQVGLAFLFGLLWMKLFSKKLIDLDQLPIEQWHFKSSDHLLINIQHQSTTTVKSN